MYYKSNMKKHKNTLQKGSIRYIVFQENEVWYAVGLEFNIVESGDTPQEAMILLFEAFSGYIESAKKIKMRPGILNQKPDSKYEKMWLDRQTKKSSLTKNVFSSGELSIGQALKGVLMPA